MRSAGSRSAGRLENRLIGGFIDIGSVGGGAACGAMASATCGPPPPVPVSAWISVTAVWTACAFTCSWPASLPPFGPVGCSPDVICPTCSAGTGATRGVALPACEYDWRVPT